jgi:hypothetical protein
MSGQSEHQERDFHLKRRIVQIARTIGEEHRGAGQEHYGESGMRPAGKRPNVRDCPKRPKVCENDRSHERCQTHDVGRFNHRE